MGKREIIKRVAIFEGIRCNPTEATICELATAIQALEQGEAHRLLTACERALQRPDTRRYDDIRIPFVKLLVACFPRSIPMISKWLGRLTGSSVYEVHFSFFCFLDQIQEIERPEGSEIEIVRLVERYLRDVPCDRAHAAWMAGDLLGDHWKLSESVPVLLHSVSEGRFVAGRSGALHGLSHAISRRPAVGPYVKKIRRAIRRAADEDRSSHVRELATSILTGCHGCI